MVCGAIRRWRLVVWLGHTPRRRLDWHRNSPRREPDPKPESLLEASLVHYIRPMTFVLTDIVMLMVEFAEIGSHADLAQRCVPAPFAHPHG